MVMWFCGWGFGRYKCKCITEPYLAEGKGKMLIQAFIRQGYGDYNRFIHAQCDGRMKGSHIGSHVLNERLQWNDEHGSVWPTK